MGTSFQVLRRVATFVESTNGGSSIKVSIAVDSDGIKIRAISSERESMRHCAWGDVEMMRWPETELINVVKKLRVEVT